MIPIVDALYNDEIRHLLREMESVCAGSAANQKLTHFISGNYSRVIFMTAGQLAAEVGVSQGSVSRFCMAMKYKGYNDFVEHLQSIIYKEMTLPKRFEFVTHAAEENDSLFKTEIQNIEAVRELVKSPGYAQLVQKIIAARNVVLLSARFSATMLPYAYYMLSKIRDNVLQVTPDNPLWETVSVMPKSDTLVIPYIFPRYSNQLLTKIRDLQELGYPIFSVTDSDYLSIKGLLGDYISVHVTSGSMFDIYSAPVLFTNLLVRDVARGMRNVDRRIEEIEAAEEARHVYYSEKNDLK